MKVKDPVICPNNHAFCTVCLDAWLQTNCCCPTCRVDITKDKPYRKVIGRHAHASWSLSSYGYINTDIVYKIMKTINQ